MGGTLKSGAPFKKSYTIPRTIMETADIARIINSNEVRSVLMLKLDAPQKYTIKKNPQKNPMVMARLNPGVNAKKELRKRAHKAGSAEKKEVEKVKPARRIAHSK